MKKWYLVYAKPRQEVLAEEQLTNQDYEVFLPRLCHRRRLRGHWQQVIEPLFPRYLFLHVDASEQSIGPVRSTIGVTGMVRFGGLPCEVPEAVIRELRERQQQGEGHIRPHRPEFARGDRVRVVGGPFAGIEAVFQSSNGEQRSMILLDLLGKLNRVRVETDYLLPTG